MQQNWSIEILGLVSVYTLDGSRETLVSLGVVVLQANLEFNSLDEFTLVFAIGLFKKPLEGASHACH